MEGGNINFRIASDHKSRWISREKLFHWKYVSTEFTKLWPVK